MHGAKERAIQLLPWMGLLLVSAGLASTRLLSELPANRLTELLVLVGITWGLAWIARRAMAMSWASGLLLAWSMLLLVFAGVLPVLATVLVALAACALAGALFPQQAPALQLATGLMLLAGAIGWVLLLPIHAGWVYLLACGSVVAWRYAALRQAFIDIGAHWRAGVTESPRWAAFAVTVAGLASTGCWLPTLQYDDLTYHLRLPWQLMEAGVYAPAPEFQIWALAPWASDILHALPQVISGAEARGPVNTVWLLLIASGAWQLASRLDAAPALRWLATAMVASLPLTPGLATSMQTELPTAAVLLWMATLVSGPRDGGMRFWLMLAVLAGGLAATKTMAAVTSVPLLVWALLRHPWPPLPRILVVIGTGLAVAGSSYLHAAWITGNPVLPLFNSVFHSPYYPPVDFADNRYQLGFDAKLLWSLTFDTSHHFESRDGAAGVALLALLGFWLAAVVTSRTRAAALVAMSALLIPLIPVQYLRYAYPGMVLLCVVAVAAVSGRPARPLLGLLVGVCVLNVCYHATGNWMLRSGAVKQVVRNAGADLPVFERFAPERAIALAMRTSGHDEGPVLLLDPRDAFIAEFANRGRTVSWYSPQLEQAAAAAASDPQGTVWAHLIRSLHAQEVIIRSETASPAQRLALQQLGAIKRLETGGREWWSLPPAGAPAP